MESENKSQLGGANQAIARLVDSAVLLTLLAIFSNFLMFHMEKGYCDYFSIPSELIVIDAPQYMKLYPHLMNILGIFGVLYVLASIVRKFRAIDRPTILQIVYWSVVLYWSLRSALAGGSWMMFGVFTGCALLLEFVLPIWKPYRSSNSLLFFIPIPRDYTTLGIVERTGFILIVSPVVLYWTVTIGHTLGDATARTRTDFLVIVSTNNSATPHESVILAKYGDYFVYAEMDSISQIRGEVGVLAVDQIGADGQRIRKKTIENLRVVNQYGEPKQASKMPLAEAVTVDSTFDSLDTVSASDSSP